VFLKQFLKSHPSDSVTPPGRSLWDFIGVTHRNHTDLFLFLDTEQGIDLGLSYKNDIDPNGTKFVKGSIK
jgi:hypothetical protein